MPALSAARSSASFVAPVPSQAVIPAAQPDVSPWLDCTAFAELSGLSPRYARRVLTQATAGQSWRGAALQVRPATDGSDIAVHAQSLPPALYQHWSQSHTPAAVTPPARAHTLTLPRGPHPLDKQAVQHRDLALWKWNLIQSALGFPKHSAARGARLRQLANLRHQRPDGRTRPISLDSLYNWVAQYEQGGLTALMRRPRGDRGQKRVGITRHWDRRCPLPAETQALIAEQLAEQVRSLWAAGVPGFRTVAELGSGILLELSQQYGWHDATLSDCQLSRAYVEQFRRYALLAMHDKDARQFFDCMVPRIRRHREGLQPMDIVVGDVHPIDILLTRPDGSTVMPRAIAWMDVATQRLHVTLVQLEKGEGIKQVHVAQAFAAMCSSWGLPRQLYLDNGAEYGWQDMMEGFAQLSRLTGAALDTRLSGADAGEHHAVIRARPYNAPAKPIEGLFGLLEQQVLSMLPGWVGGNRMRQKTHNIGRAPRPYPGDWAAFHQSFEQALAYYHARPQPRSRSLQGQSPNDALRAAIEAGWGGAAEVDPLALRVAFSREETRLVQGGGYIHWHGTTYFHDALVAHNGKRLQVRFAKWDTRYLFVFDERNQLICAAEAAPAFAFLGADGARTQAQRNQHLKRHLQDLRADTVRLDLESVMQRRTAQVEQAPEIPKGPRIALTPALQQMMAVLRQVPAAALQPSRPSPRLKQWATAPNALLEAFASTESDTPLEHASAPVIEADTQGGAE
ncbi:Mu transposase C-terminal domain-containing protein [Pseudomonas resinovorans]|uniref:Mu transposase C-terminal domain-containing protein n=1 Tax=Metapseudomonas resinovorans TaxID=53412 RepID=A0ABT4Y886_METRE|nr:transposase [Pseudomonas resinovorans]MDA8484780.1 Mu transposase C-terminal domain-containing protein [Pseudomonas resinovorans]